MTNEQKLAYLAGILDGEGFISIGFNRKSRGHHATVGVTNTSLTLITWLRDNFGGTFSTRSPAKEGWKVRYEWRLRGTGIDDLMPKVIPYLVVKAEQATLLLKFRQSLGRKGAWPKPVPEPVIQEREKIRMRIKHLNRDASL